MCHTLSSALARGYYRLDRSLIQIARNNVINPTFPKTGVNTFLLSHHHLTAIPSQNGPYFFARLLMYDQRGGLRDGTRTWSRDRHSHPNAAEGTIDHVLNILDEYSHPFILVGHVALRWMGCSSSVDAGFDLVLRTFQLPAIVTSLVETGLWTIFDCPKAFGVFKSNAACQDLENDDEKRVLEYHCEADAVLKWEGIEGIGFSCMRLWTEETYHIDIDTSQLVEVPELYPWNPFLVEKEFHPALRRDDGWFYGPRILNDVAANNGADGIFNTIYERTKGARSTSPINILSIPAYLDVLVYHTIHYATSKHGLASVAVVQINNLTKDLFLELPHQMIPLLFQVEAETESCLQSYFAGWKRMSRSVMSRSKGRVPVNAWDPYSYPEDLITPYVRMSIMPRGPPYESRAPSTGTAAE